MSNIPINLLQETINVLNVHGKSLEDVKWVGTYNLAIPIEQFLELADVEYNNGYGGEEVYTNLLVVGNNWWLERGTYDGSEWWEFKQLPKKPKKIGKVLGIIRDQDEDIQWEGLKTI